jgi:hypothetical protein
MGCCNQSRLVHERTCLACQFHCDLNPWCNPGSIGPIFTAARYATLNNFILFFGDVMTADEAVGRLVPSRARMSA